MKHYRIYKLDDRTDKIVRARSLDAASDAEALAIAAADADCPKCEVWQSVNLVGRIG